MLWVPPNSLAAMPIIAPLGSRRCSNFKLPVQEAHHAFLKSQLAAMTAAASSLAWVGATSATRLLMKCPFNRQGYEITLNLCFAVPRCDAQPQGLRAHGPLNGGGEAPAVALPHGHPGGTLALTTFVGCSIQSMLLPLSLSAPCLRSPPSY